MLAYINQEEADLLKARGGSGKPHADTGVPSFEEEELFSDIGLAPRDQGVSFQAPYADQQIQSQTVAPLDVTSQSGSPFAAYERATTPDTARYFQENQAAGAAPKIDLGQSSFYPSDADIAAVGDRFKTPAELGFQPGGSEAPTTKVDKDLLGQVSDLLPNLSDETKKRLGIAGIQGLIGAYQSQQASEQGRQAKEEMQRMAQPYQQQGKRLIEQAQRGELSAVGQQQLQAVQAQAAQGAQARGGVGAQQAQAQVEAYRQQLLQGQYDYGLKVAGIGDQIMTGAIKTGMQADQYVNQLTSNYYNNIARAMYGQAPQVSGSQPASTSAGQ